MNTQETSTAINNQSVQPLVSVVVIGRNEGERLERCLHSVAQADWHGNTYELIYVDSRSTDTSVAKAETHGAQVLVLVDASPCAAKARNLGWRAAQGQYVLFLDGDTQLHAEFVQRALATLSEPRLCAAWGHRRESKPQQSLYTKVLDLDWIYPTGRTLYFGGDVLVRREALAQVDGFDPSLKAGEEPELCARLRAMGWEIEHIDAPMTLHDLAVNSFRAYWLRAYRSGIAYAEVAQRMRLRGDVLWQYESRRDFYHGLLFTVSPVLLLAAWWLSPALAVMLLGLAFVYLCRTAIRCAWKAPGQWWLCMQYAVHAHFQKIPALFGQLKWHQAASRHSEIALIDYKQESGQGRLSLKALLVKALAPMAWCQRVIGQRWIRVWSFARLQEGIGRQVDPSNVIMGKVELHGTRNIHLGSHALIYPGVYLETQGEGSITLGDGVVLSTGVHIVAFERVVLGSGCMVGEYSSIRDANHRLDSVSIRHSGHVSAAIVIGNNVWMGRGVGVLMGAGIGDNSVVAANAVVTKPVGAQQIVGGVPAKVLRQNDPLKPSPSES
jgi:acetyltransferase-like isoleucine patch superfamily enzyme/glycosyltransferase involved in cell wall biosynthesis